MIPAKGHVKNYHWGKIGDDNHIAKFLAFSQSQTHHDVVHRDNHNKKDSAAHQHLAELWFGSHPSGPSIVSIGSNEVALDKFLAREPEMIGSVDKYFKYNKQLPFLFKILSVAQPLSLQAHPDKELAKVLHQRDPKNYPDSNHKPELAIALTDFEVLCDFRPHSEIAHYIKNIVPLRQVIGEIASETYVNLVANRKDDTTQLGNSLGECFRSLMVRGSDVIIKGTKELMSSTSDDMGKGVKTLISELDRLYPGDPGVFAPFFLNHFKLSPGQAIYLKPNKLHAYISGDCIECMACSDNVVRAGLTTKFRDISTLLNMLDYKPVGRYQDLILGCRKEISRGYQIDLFAPIDDFKVEKIVISDEQEFSMPSVDSGSFILVMSGMATTQDFFNPRVRHKMAFGFSGYVPPKVSVKFADIQGTLVMYRAFC